MSVPVHHVTNQGNIHGSNVIDQQGVVSTGTPATVIIGAGPVGVRLLKELVALNIDSPVIVYGGEPTRPYNRARLSDYLAGNVDLDGLYLEKVTPAYSQIEYRYNCPVEAIDRINKTVTDLTGRTQRYKQLVLATGSTPFIPKFGNRHYEGIYSFRTLREADELLSRNTRTRHTIIIGGGMHGLETARAMQKYNTRITVVEHNHWLMMQQLDEQGASFLQDFITAKGIDVVLGDSVVSVTGRGRVEGVTLRSGRILECDTVIVAAGIRPNIGLATEAGIACNRGIKVNDMLATSDPNIYAIGECAQYGEHVCGMVRSGYEQATVLANHLAGGAARYTGSASTTRLKIMSQPIFSAGRIGVDEVTGGAVSEYVFRNAKAGLYRKILVLGNRIIGAVSVGQWHEEDVLGEALLEKRIVWFWQLWRFKLYGYLWGKEHA